MDHDLNVMRLIAMRDDPPKALLLIGGGQTQPL